MRRTLRPLPMMVFMALLFGCGTERRGTHTLLVGAAISLSEPLEHLARLYHEHDSSVVVTFSFASSGTLAQQIRNDAPIDIFISAAPEFVDSLVQAGFLLRDSRTTIASNRLILVRPHTASTPTSLSDLRTVRRIAIGNPETVPAGKYAREVLVALNLWDASQTSIVPAKDARQVLTYVERGVVDAGFVYLSDSFSSTEVSTIDTIDPSLHSAIAYDAAIVARSKQRSTAEAFLRFLSTQTASPVFELHGFQSISARDTP